LGTAYANGGEKSTGNHRFYKVAICSTLLLSKLKTKRNFRVRRIARAHLRQIMKKNVALNAKTPLIGSKYV
jgi:hypothetical protein